MNSLPIQAMLKKNQGHFHPVVPFDPAVEKITALDFTAANTELTDEILTHTNQFMQYINAKLAASGSKFGIGGYAEHRTIYSRSKVFDGATNEEEPRRLHLGVDIWGRPHTPVMAPLDGMVHSFAFNGAYGDYGATIILTHQLEELVFHSLYGHLSLNSIKNLQEGQRVSKGDVIAEFGLPFENGQWPPHLHFQLIVVMPAHKGDYPGVCRFSEKEKYLANCPDPDLILDLQKHTVSDSRI
jgi:peptidoglycan LD-endopeptidase LytH